MRLRRTTVLAVAGLILALLPALTIGIGAAAAQTGPARISFQIITGSTGGTYFPVGQLMAGLISHPPGVARCEIAAVCGPPGLIVSARTSDGAVANILAVNGGTADSGFAQADVVADAVAGSGAFHAAGKQSQIRTMAVLFPEDVHLLVARNSKIAKVADLRGKRVSLGVPSSGTSVTARAILSAYHLAHARLRLRRDSADVDAQLMQKGQLDAFFFVGGPPVGLIDDLIARGVARLLPIDGAGRAALLKAVPALHAATIPAGTYHATPAIETVSVNAIWIVNRKIPDELVHGIVKSLFNSGNRAALHEEGGSAAQIRLDTAINELPAPLHPGAARFFREAGRLTNPKTHRD